MCMENLFPALCFQSLCVFRSEMTLIQAAYLWAFFLLHSASLYILIGPFNPFTFQVTVDRYVLISLCLLFWGFCSSFCFFFYSLSLWFDNCLQYYVWIPFSFLACVYLLQVSDLRLPGGSSLTPVHTCLLLVSDLKFNYILTTLHFHSSKSHLTFLLTYFTSFLGFVSLSYCRCWCFYFWLLTPLLPLYMADTTFTVCLPVSSLIYMFPVVFLFLSFLLREVFLTFLLKPI